MVQVSGKSQTAASLELASNIYKGVKVDLKNPEAGADGLESVSQQAERLLAHYDSLPSVGKARQVLMCCWVVGSCGSFAARDLQVRGLS